MALFQQFNQVGVTLLIASHDPHHFAMLADKHLQLTRGVLAEEHCGSTNVTPFRRVNP